jgi:hypothetical protein
MKYRENLPQYIPEQSENGPGGDPVPEGEGSALMKTQRLEQLRGSDSMNHHLQHNHGSMRLMPYACPTI